MRLGHIFSADGGVFPYFELASRFGASIRLERGDQFIPWVHIEDAANSINFVSCWSSNRNEGGEAD